MPHLCNTLLLAAFGAVSFCSNLHAGIIGDALFSFPGQTGYLEDDNLAALRKLPYYAMLRNEFSGEPLEEARIVLGQLGISEAQVEEVVTGSNTKATYGLATGTFSKSDPAVKTRLKRYETKLFDTQMYCAGRATCVLFLEDSVAAFGKPDSLKAMLLARQGLVSRLSTNSEAAGLLDAADRSAPIRGILFGKELQSLLANTPEEWFGKQIRSMNLSGTVTAIGYDVKFGAKVRVDTTVECSSATAAGLLAQAVNALSSFRSIAPSLFSGNAFTFERAQASAVGSRIYMTVDAKEPARRNN